MRPSRHNASTQKTLLRTMHVNDSQKFSQILDDEGWPENSEWSDYELLLHSIKHNHRRITNILLDKGARVFKYDNRSRVNTPLHLAATKKTAGWPQVVSRLLSQGASITYKNSKGETPLHSAFSAKAPGPIVDAILLEIMKRKSVLRQCTFNKDRLGFLHIACTRTNLDVVSEILDADKSLLNLQVHPTSKSIYAGYTPLHFAVENERFEIADYLLHKGADIYRQSAKGSTPLHLALESRNIDMIDLILSYDVDKMNTINNSGVSHFMAACAGTNENLVANYLRSSSTNALVSSQIQTVTHPNSGYTPLHFAAEFGRRHTVELLLSRGANCCVLAVNNLTPHLLAHQNRHDNVARLLDKRCNTCQWSTETSRVLGHRYEKLVEHDEFGDIVIRFERREGTDSSSDEDSIHSEDDIARLSHDDLLSFFLNEKNSSSAENLQSDVSFDCDFLENAKSSEVRDDNTGRVTNEAGVSVSFEIDQLTPLNIDFYRAVEDLIADGVDSASEEKLVGNGIKDSGAASDDFTSSQNVLDFATSQFSIPIENQFLYFDNTAAPAFVPSPQDPYVNTIDSSSLNLIKVPSVSPTQAVQVPEVNSVPWSPTSRRYCDLPVDSLTTDSGLSNSSSFTGSCYTGSSLNFTSQTDMVSINRNQTNALDYTAPSQSFELIDYFNFLPAASSTPFYNDVPTVVNNSFNQSADMNGNKFMDINGNVHFYKDVSYA